MSPLPGRVAPDEPRARASAPTAGRPAAIPPRRRTPRRGERRVQDARVGPRPPVRRRLSGRGRPERALPASTMSRRRTDPQQQRPRATETVDHRRGHQHAAEVAGTARSVGRRVLELAAAAHSAPASTELDGGAVRPASAVRTSSVRLARSRSAGARSGEGAPIADPHRGRAPVATSADQEPRTATVAAHRRGRGRTPQGARRRMVSTVRSRPSRLSSSGWRVSVVTPASA